MPALTQAQMARELHISRATMSDNARAGCPLTSVGEAKHWRSCNVREKWNQAAHDASERARPHQPDVEPQHFDDGGEDEIEAQPKNLFDPCPELPMVTAADMARKYIHWGLYFRGLPRDTVEWMANYLVDEIKGGRGDEDIDEKLKLLRRKFKAKTKPEKVPAKG